jgi:plastocyanin
MQKTLLLSGIIMAIVVAGGALFFMQDGSSKKVEEVLGEPTVTIVRTNSGYEPNEITIKKGDIVLWKNESSDFHWPASDIHPTHTIYPEFDPLRAIAPGEDWKFKFDEVGTWKFHDHIRANKTGIITVTD